MEQIFTQNPTEPPSWLYKKVEIQNLSEIQHELQEVSKFVISDIENLIPEFYYVPRSNVESMMPKTQMLLKQMGLLDRWKYLALVTGNHGSSLPIHVDATDWQYRSYGLNLPVLNCEGSFTVYYTAEILQPTVSDPNDPRTGSYYCKEDTAVEIGRIESINPCWVNVIIPHRPVMTHQKPRILASFRFSPEVHDFF